MMTVEEWYKTVRWMDRQLKEQQVNHFVMMMEPDEIQAATETLEAWNGYCPEIRPARPRSKN